MRLIMLCGQGGAGKSTYGKWLVKQLNDTILISVDTFVCSGYNKEDAIKKFYNEINEKCKEKKYKNIIIDFSHDNAGIRLRTLKNSLNDINIVDIDFITIALRPGAVNVLWWSYNRLTNNGTIPISELNEKQKNIFQKETQEKILSIYNHFEYPTPEEFKDYNFKSTTHIIIDNSKPYERLFW